MSLAISMFILIVSWHFTELNADNFFTGVLAPLFVFLSMMSTVFLGLVGGTMGRTSDSINHIVTRYSSDDNSGGGDSGGGGGE